MKFERERLFNIKNQNHVDTFEKFLDFAEEEIEIVETHQKKILAQEAKNQHCTVCQTLLAPNLKFSKDQIPLCPKCSNDYASGLCGDQEKGEKKRVAKLMSKIGELEKSSKAKKEAAHSHQVHNVSAMSSNLRPD